MTEIKEQIKKWNEMLPAARATTQVEAERRAGEFLVANAHIAEWVHLFRDSKIKAESVQVATFSAEMNKSESKLVTEKKAQAEASKEYMTAREDFEYVENDISYLKTYQEIYNNAHIFYRGIAKDSG